VLLSAHWLNVQYLISIDNLDTFETRTENMTEEGVDEAMHKLNHRPRKTLNCKTPHSVFFADNLLEAA